MASFECDNCGERYPHKMKYQDCPVCQERCRRVKDEPSVSDWEAQRRIERQERQAAFEEWCVANGRRPADLQPTYIELSESTDEARQLAMIVCHMIEELYPTYCIGELHVFWP